MHIWRGYNEITEQVKRLRKRLTERVMVHRGLYNKKGEDDMKKSAKRIFAGAMAAAMMLSLTACGGGSSTETTAATTAETVMHVFIASAGVFVACMFPIHQFLYLFSTSHGLFSIPLRHTRSLSLPKTSSGKCSNRTGCSLPS